MNKKINNRGFMMVEVVVVAAIILGVLTGIYTSYGKVFNRYTEILDYLNIDGVYKLASYRDQMIVSEDTDNINSVLKVVSTSDMLVYGNKSSKYPGVCIFKTSSLYGLINSPSSALNTGRYIDPNSDLYISPAYREYISYLADSVSFTKNYVMVYSYPKDDNSNYYSYLELEA